MAGAVLGPAAEPQVVRWRGGPPLVFSDWLTEGQSALFGEGSKVEAAMNVTNGLLCLILAVLLGQNIAREGNPSDQNISALLMWAALLAAVVFFIDPARIVALVTWLWHQVG